MFAYMCKYLGENGKETDIIVFPWEQKKFKKLSEEEAAKMVIEQAEAEAYFARIDERRKANK